MADKNVNINFRIDTDLRDRWNAVMEKKGCKTGAVLRLYMHKYVEAEEDKSELNKMLGIEEYQNVTAGKSDMVHVRMSTDMVARFQAIAKAQGTNGSTIGRRLIEQFVKQYESRESLN